MEVTEYRKTFDILKEQLSDSLFNMNSVLDVGCDFPRLLFDLQQFYGFQRCVAVDKNPLRSWNSMGPNAIRQCNEIKEKLYELAEFDKITWQKYYELLDKTNDDWLYGFCYCCICDFEYGKIQPLFKEEFYKIFDLNFKKHITDFINVNKESFDLIICSKILSHLENAAPFYSLVLNFQNLNIVVQVADLNSFSHRLSQY